MAAPKIVSAGTLMWTKLLVRILPRFGTSYYEYLGLGIPHPAPVPGSRIVLVGFQ